MALAVDLFSNDEQLEDIFPVVEFGNNPYTSKGTEDRAFYASIATEPMGGDEAFESIVARNKELIATGKENIIEKQAAIQRNKRKVEANTSIQRDLLYTPSSSELIKQFEENRLNIEQRDEQSAIEKEAIQRLQDLMVEDPYQAAIYVNRIQQGDLIDRQRDHATKVAIFQREYDKLQASLEGQGIAESAFDLLLGVVDLPLASLGEVLNFERPLVEGVNRGLFTRPSTKVQKEAQSLWSPDVSVDEFDEKIKQAAQRVVQNSGVIKDNRRIALQDFTSLRGMNNSDALTYDFMTGVDLLTAPGAGLAAKSISNPIRMAKALGNRAAAVRGVSGQLLRPSSEVSTNAAAVRESLPSSLVPDIPGWSDASIGLSGDVAERVAVIQSVRKNLTNIITPERATPEQYAYAVEQKVEEVVGRLKDENIVDIKMNVDPDTRIRYVNLFLGRKTGEGGYLTEQAAKGSAVRRGFSLEDVELHHGVDDRWYIKVRADVPENGIYQPTLKEADLPNTGRAWGWVKNPDNSVAQIFSETRHLAEGAKSRISGQIIRPLVKPLKKLNKKEINDMNAIFVVGEREQKWFTPEELHYHYERLRGTGPTDKEIVAYYAAKELNDFDWAVRNRETYIKRARLGYETVHITDGLEGGFDTGRRNGIVLTSDEIRGKRIYDVEEHTGYAPGTNDEAILEKLNTGNYNLVRLEGTYTYSNEPIKYILVHNKSMTRGPLAQQQLGYVAGGHRLYRDKWFVKQANSVEFKDGSTAWDNPLTHIVAKTQKQARKWAEGMEQARLAYLKVAKGELDITDAEIIISENTSLDYKKFDEMVKKGQINTRHKFEVLYDRTMPTEMTQVGESSLWIDEFADGTDQWYNTSGRMYYSPKGERLKNPFDEYAEILDPMTTLQKSITNALGTRAASDYTTYAIEEWARIASPYIKRGTFSENPDKRRLFYDGVFDDDFIRNNPELHRSLEANRDVIKRFLGQQTFDMKGKEMAIRRVAAWLESEKPGVQKLIPEPLRDWAAGKTMDMMDANPVNAIRGLVFDTQLGFFDPGQFFVQTQTALASIAIDPKNGPAAAAMWPFIRLVGTNLNENVLDYVATRGKLVHGLDPAEFKTMVRTMIKTGEYDISGDIIELGHYANNFGGNAVVRGFSDFRNAGRVIFNEAEALNRTVAWQLAWKDVRKRMPNAALDSVEFIQAVKLRAADFGMNMRHASSAAWQKGVVSIPTQFMSYQARLLENMLPKMFGGNPRFSGAQKFRLALSQALLYGTAGLPIVDWVGDEWKKHRGDDLSPEAWRAVTKGFWDSFFYTVSGGEVDTDFASRAGIGEGWSQTVEKLVNGDLNSYLSVLAGPTGTVTGDFFDSFNRIAMYGRAGLDGGFLTKEAFNLIMNDLASNINTLERANKAQMILRYGRIVDRKSGQPIVDATQLEAFAALMGIPLREEREIYEMLDEVYDRQQEVKDMAKLLAKINDEFFKAMERGDEEAMDNSLRLRAGIIQSYADDPLKQQQISKQALTYQSYTTDRMGYAREQYQQILGKQVPTEEQE